MMMRLGEIVHVEKLAANLARLESRRIGGVRLRPGRFFEIGRQIGKSSFGHGVPVQAGAQNRLSAAGA
jgi:hypothetical protein